MNKHNMLGATALLAIALNAVSTLGQSTQGQIVDRQIDHVYANQAFTRKLREYGQRYERSWVKNVLDQWLQAANITSGQLFRRVHKMGKSWGERLTEKAVWHVVREYATKAGIDKLAPHNLRRTCARLCHAAGGELEQIQFLLGHISIQTTDDISVANSAFKAPSMTKSE